MQAQAVDFKLRRQQTPPSPRSDTEGSPPETEQSGITPQCVMRGTGDRPCCPFQSLSSQTQGASIPICSGLPSVLSIALLRHLGPLYIPGGRSLP